MIELILSAITLGVILSLFLIGPIFFIIIETSLLKGYKAAIMLDIGVFLADIMCITIAYYSSKEIIEYIRTNTLFFKLGGVIIFSYGWFLSFFSKKVNNIKIKILKYNNYLGLLFKGFLLNIINAGVIVFWISIVIFVSSTYHNSIHVVLYIVLVLITAFCLDMIKIFLGVKMHKKIKNNFIQKIRKILGFIIMIFGIILFIKSFIPIKKTINNYLLTIISK